MSFYHLRLLQRRTAASLACRSRGGFRLSAPALAAAQYSSGLTQTPLKGPRISTLFAILLCLGIGTTAYGVYEFYTAMALWPPEVRADLRAGVKAKHQNDLVLSEKYLRRAWQTAQTLPPDTFAPEPYLKISGIGIALAGVLEAHEMPKEAYEVYSDVLRILQRELDAGRLGGEERMRAVAVACKLGAMAEEWQQPAEEEERWLSWAVGELLKVVKDHQGRAGQGVDEVEASQASARVVLSELDLPSWASRQDVVAPLEALGAFYARTGNVEYAVPLYLHAMSVLIPPPGQKPSSAEDRCRGAQLMNNLAELLIRNSPTPERLHQAEDWAKQAKSVIDKTRESVGGKSASPPTCEETLAAVLFNIGSLREIANDHSTARDMFTAALTQSKDIGMKQGVLEARNALRRLERQQTVTQSTRSQMS